jgi:hypothetical protein
MFSLGGQHANWLLSVPSVKKARADPIIMMKDRLCPGTTPYSQGIQVRLG